MRFPVECYENQQSFRDSPVIHEITNLDEWIGQPMRCVTVLAIDAESAADAAEEAFYIGNMPGVDAHGNRWPRTRRSMSSGDVVVVGTPDGRVGYAILSFGTTTVDPTALNRVVV